MHPKIRLIHLLWKPIFFINEHKKSHSTRSYALLISSFIVIKPDFLAFLFFMWCKVSKTTKMLSKIAISTWKALYESKIISGKIFLSLFANTFDTNLYKILHKAIGRNKRKFWTK